MESRAVPKLNGQSAQLIAEQIASIIAEEKAYNVPAVCRRYGLADGTGEEAFAGKFRYVLARLKELGNDKLLEVAIQVQTNNPNYALGEALAKLNETGPLVSELTRRRIVDLMDGRSIAGKLRQMDFLERIWPLNEFPPLQGSLDATHYDFIVRHWVRNDDLSNSAILEGLGIYTCSQRQFFRFLETLTHPLTRDGDEQLEFVGSINEKLVLDGFELTEVSRISGSPLFVVRHSATTGSPADPGISNTLASFNSKDIHERWEEALKRRSSDPRAAITLARTLLEDTCKWIIHSDGQEYSDTDDLPALYRKLSKILKLAPDDYTEQVFKQILGSCQSIVEALGSIRNKLGDAHSQGPKRARPQIRHAELAVNLAGTMATFLVATWEERQKSNEKR